MWVIITKEHTPIDILQPITSLPSIPTRVFTLEGVPQSTYYDDVPNEIAHGLRDVFSMLSNKQLRRRTT